MKIVMELHSKTPFDLSYLCSIEVVLVYMHTYCIHHESLIEKDII